MDWRKLSIQNPKSKNENSATMDFNLPEELQLLKETVRKFVDRELIPLEHECRPEGEDMPEQYIKPLQEKAKLLVCGCSTCRRNTAAPAWI